MSDPLLATAPARHASVHASAGTGKTWLLVTRIVRLLLAGAAPAGILAVTFTRKAAAEMLERLNDRLAGLATDDAAAVDRTLRAMGETPSPALRDRARRLYEALLFDPRPVRATTFHAFCQEILQRFPIEAEVPPGFELLDNDAELVDEAWDALYAEATQAPESAIAGALEQLFDTCGTLANTRQALNDFLSHRIDWWAFTQTAREPAAYAAAGARRLFGVDPDDDPIETFFAGARPALLAEFATLLGRHDTKTHREHSGAILQALALREAAADDSREARLALVTGALLTKSGEPRKRNSSKALENALGAAGCDRLLQLHGLLCDALLELRDRLARHASLALNVAWYRAGQRLLDHYQRIKRERRVLDFADLEWHAYRLLTASGQAHWVQYKLDARIDHILIDEFQDTNPTQWRLLLPLLEELAAGTGERARSVFLVGDTKQSIYRFRRADARLLSAASEWLEARLGAQRFSLEASRRSAPAIIDCVNRAFADGPLAARLPDFPVHSTHWTDLWGRVELLPPLATPPPSADAGGTTAAALRDPLLQPRPQPADDRHEDEGRIIAARIRDLVDDGTLIGPTAAARPLRYGDILILLRGRTHAGAYEKALRDAGIPFLGAARGTLLDNLEVRDLEALLNTLVAPHNDLALAQVLRSPLFAAGDEDLIRLAQTRGNGWMERLLRIAADGDADDAAPLARAARLLPAWSAWVGRLPVHDLLDRIYHEGDVLARFEAAASPALKPRVRANLIRFIELALEVDSGRYPSLPHFVARLAELRARADAAPDDAPPESGAGDRVRFLTVHGAKGLEAPVVFLADCGRSDRDRSAWGGLVDWPAERDRPETFVLVGRKSGRDRVTADLLARQQAAEQREDANLLYVALTRARQLLFVSAAVTADNADQGWYGLLRAQWCPQDAADTPFVHETGAPPATAAAPAAPPPATVAVDPRLRERLRIAPALVRIAPSRAGAAVDVRDPAGAGDPDGRTRGIAIHRLLEGLSAAPPRGRTHLLTDIARELQRDVADPELLSWLQEAEAVTQDPALAPLFDAARYERAYAEVPLHYCADGALVDGIVDRLLVHPHEAHVIDYKTHAIAADQAEATARHYRDQLRLYAEGARRLWPDRRVRASILFTRCRTLVDLEV